MRNARIIPFIVAAGVAGIWMAGHAQSPGGGRFVVAGGEAFLLAPAELVAAPTVTRAEWSPDARYVLAVRRDERPDLSPRAVPQGDISLVLWNRATRQSQELWKRPIASGSVDQIAWFPGTSIGLAVVFSTPLSGRGEGPHWTLLRIEGLRFPVRAIAGMSPTERVWISPRKPVAFLHNSEQRTLRIVGTNGNVGAPIALGRAFSHSWSEEGDLLLEHWEHPPASGQRSVRTWFAVDARSVEIRALAEAPRIYRPEAPALPVRLRQAPVVLKEGDATGKIQALWLESAERGEHVRALLSADAEGPQLAPDGNAALYRAQGAAWVTSFLRVRKEPFLQARRAALKAVAIANGKQIGTGVMMYIQDYDEMLPPPDAVTSRLHPYLKNEDVFKIPGTETPGFVYLQNALPLSSFKEPAKTILGYLPGPGGRAVIFLDGHVVWEGE